MKLISHIHQSRAKLELECLAFNEDFKKCELKYINLSTLYPLQSPQHRMQGFEGGFFLSPCP